MTVSAGGSRRANAPPSEHERARAVATIRRCGSEGLLSTREVEEQIELAFRAKSVAALDSVVSGLPYTPQIAADVVLTHGLQAEASKAQAPWWRGILVWSLSLDVLWVIIWFITGGAVGWLVLAIAATMIAFTFRLSSRYRRRLTAKPARRRRIL